MTDHPSLWQGKSVLITGGAGGMGLAFAERFHAAGASLALADIDQARLAQAVKTFAPDCLTIPSDVTRVEDCSRMVSETLARFGRL
ncbi:MAG TPA: SDR family NAD(P)-dependent oxidoreductase, partial [Dongiaceae bacterium]